MRQCYSSWKEVKKTGKGEDVAKNLEEGEAQQKSLGKGETQRKNTKAILARRLRSADAALKIIYTLFKQMFTQFCLVIM